MFLRLRRLSRCLLLLTVSCEIVCFRSPIAVFADSLVRFARSGVVFADSLPRDSSAQIFCTDSANLGASAQILALSANLQRKSGLDLQGECKYGRLSANLFKAFRFARRAQIRPRFARGVQVRPRFARRAQIRSRFARRAQIQTRFTGG